MEQWYFCVVDVVEVLTESKDPSGYIKTMKRRDPMLAKGWGQIVTPLFVQTPGGRQKMNFSTMKGIFRIIQAITSPKAEPFKQWIAQVAKIRRNQERDVRVQHELAAMGWHSITIWECELKPSKREQTLLSLVYTLSHIWMKDNTKPYSLPEDELSIAAEGK